MKVLMLGWDFRPEHTGGVGAACRGIAEGLVRLGAEVTVVAPSTERAAGLASLPLPSAPAPSIPSPHPPRGDRRARAAVAQPPGTPRSQASDRPRREGAAAALRMLRVASPLTPYLTQADYTRTAPRPAPYAPDLLAEVRRFAARVVEGTAELAFDVVHAHDWMTLPAGLALAERSGKPLVWHVHSTEYDRRPSAPDAAVRRVEQLGLDHADRVVAVSQRTVERLEEHYRVDPGKLCVVHNAVHRPAAAPAARPGTAAPLPADAPPVVLFLARLTEQKDPLTFLRAAARASLVVPEARFVVAGGGELLPDLIAEAERLGLGRRVHFTGPLTGADVERAFARADVYVLSSVAEPFGIAALEAMCADVPVVVTRESGVAEVLTSALKVDAGDVEALADRMVALLRHRALRETLVTEGREEVGRMRWEVRAQALIDLFGELQA